MYWKLSNIWPGQKSAWWTYYFFCFFTIASHQVLRARKNSRHTSSRSCSSSNWKYLFSSLLRVAFLHEKVDQDLVSSIFSRVHSDLRFNKSSGNLVESVCEDNTDYWFNLDNKIRIKLFDWWINLFALKNENEKEPMIKYKFCMNWKDSLKFQYL